MEIWNHMSITFPNLSTELEDVAEKISQSSVKIRHGNIGIGSGVVWKSDGLIITNAHVAVSEKLTVELCDGREFQAVRTKIDPTKDLAALKIDADCANVNLNPATISDRKNLRVGEIVLAVGNPLGDTNAVTTGIISQIHQNSVISDIQLYPGNSGGAMTDSSGNIIGINTMIAYGLAVAISSQTVERFLTTVNDNDKPRKLGVTLKPLIIGTSKQPTLGLLVLSVNRHSYAEASGIQIGDILIGVSGRLFRQLDDLTNYLQVGNHSELQIIRGGKQINLNLDFDNYKTTSEV
ncbi:trypsin-like serine protease with C-terminal PDZ domain [Rivularia sp. PCC 7116]|uniref:S1C family serine protease n=1 Tax=Rivularia sp. PCC 7116 TaxID=373994 RepID=UPI00029F304A|nr:trypsin-like peptidase domain-containing protein [Rivularia sp. PCC 7116]AFY56461.1 trypsin-like serine protease with C-terminal PDZ domain [Rivularia sp. PCC 7116]